MKQEQRCKVCDNYSFTPEELKEKLSGVYYIKGWKEFVWRYFMKKVLPDIIEGWKKHNRLIAEGHIVHKL